MTDETVTAPEADEATEAAEDEATEAAEEVAETVPPVDDSTAPDAPVAAEEATDDAAAPDAVAGDSLPDGDATAPDAAEPVGESTPASPGVDAEEPVVEIAELVVADPAAAVRELGDIPDDLSEEDFAAAVERTVVEFSEGSLVKGIVARIDPDAVLVDIGYKSEGVIPLKELSIRNSVNPADVVSEGEEIEALVLTMEDSEGRLILSKKRAQYERAWGRVEQVMKQGGTVNGQVIEVVKGGLIVDIGLRGFLPASLVELRRVRDLHPYIGETLEAKVIELDKNRNNVVLSRRAWLEEAQAEQRQAFLDELAPGEIRDGVVSSVVNFGAFVDLGGMDGLVHVSELSWQHVSHPSEMVT
ncbi:MAG: S1 RNA-binding domain-containing protein, partial [Gaiellales bacterium]